MSSSAELTTFLKSKADTFFKELRFTEAASFYQQALDLDESKSIVLNSNLSACFFEMGNEKSNMFKI